MMKLKPFYLFLAFVFLLSGNLQAQQASMQQNAVLPYQDTNLSAGERAEDLLHRLTLEEKVQLMMNGSPAIPRLGIKAYGWWNEALHGLARCGYATVFPQAIGMAASFNDSLLHNVFTAVSDEARIKCRRLDNNGNLSRYQALTVWTPNINIFRDPRWGRGQETYGEDPYLTTRMGLAVVRGLQGPDTAKYDKLHACAKHFAVHSGPEWNRHSFNALDVVMRDLWETYLPAFEALVKDGGVKEVICAYNRYEGDPCCGSNRLLTQILRNEWGFDGVVVSDCGAISDFWQPKKHETHEDAASASADAVLSGTDLECGSNYKALTEAVKRGLIKEEQLDTSLRRLLRARFELGEMDDDVWTWIPDSLLNSWKHKQLALQMARESLVLLQNKNRRLPLDKGAKVVLIGPNATDSVMQWGNYNGLPLHTITLLDGMREFLPEGNLVYEPVCGFTDTTLFVSRFDECRMNGAAGFSSRYWNDDNFEGEVVNEVQQSTPLAFNTNGAAPFVPGVKLKGFSAEYHTVFYPKHTEDVEFRIQMRGVYELYVNGELVKTDEGAIKQITPIYTLKAKAGKAYDLKLRYRHIEKSANLIFDFGTNRLIDVDAFLNKIKDVDVVVFAGGISPRMEGEEMPVKAPGFRGGDRTEIELPAIQRQVIAALKNAGKHVVLVNFSGSAIALLPESENCDAILQAWYPGQAGGKAVAEVLFGDYNPSGKLPVTFYRYLEQLPDYEDYSMKGRTYRYMEEAPLFPFGHGLSYTTFSYKEAKADKTVIPVGGTLKLTVPVENEGDCDGTEIVQVYLSKEGDAEGPIKTLRSFKRVFIPKGKTRYVDFVMGEKELGWWTDETNTVRMHPGKYDIWVGGSSDTGKLQKMSIMIKDL